MDTALPDILGDNQCDRLLTDGDFVEDNCGRDRAFLASGMTGAKRDLHLMFRQRGHTAIRADGGGHDNFQTFFLEQNFRGIDRNGAEHTRSGDFQAGTRGQCERGQAERENE